MKAKSESAAKKGSDDIACPRCDNPNAYKYQSEQPLQLYTVMQVAKILNIGKNTAYELVNNGEINFFRINNRIRISADQISEFLTKSLNAPKID
jgi:excisionase family DNA binding protein